MAKGPYLTDSIKGYIADVYRQNPQVKPTAARTLVLDLMREKGLDRVFGRDFPGVSAVSKALKDFRDKDQARPASSEELDEPWDISSLGRYPIAQEALLVVLDVSMQSQQPLTIREAQWIGCLYRLLGAIASQQGLDKVPVSFIGDTAAFYAATERINELVGKRLPTGMDNILWKLLTKRETLKSISEAYKREFHPGMKDDRFRMDEDGRLYYRVTKAERAELEKRHHALYSTPFDNFSSLGLTLEVKEVQDERQHKAKRQK